MLNGRKSKRVLNAVRDFVNNFRPGPVKTKTNKVKPTEPTKKLSEKQKVVGVSDPSVRDSEKSRVQQKRAGHVRGRLTITWKSHRQNGMVKTETRRFLIRKRRSTSNASAETSAVYEDTPFSLAQPCQSSMTTAREKVKPPVSSLFDRLRNKQRSTNTTVEHSRKIRPSKTKCAGAELSPLSAKRISNISKRAHLALKKNPKQGTEIPEDQLNESHDFLMNIERVISYKNKGRLRLRGSPSKLSSAITAVENNAKSKKRKKHPRNKRKESPIQQQQTTQPEAVNEDITKNISPKTKKRLHKKKSSSSSNAQVSSPNTTTTKGKDVINSIQSRRSCKKSPRSAERQCKSKMQPYARSPGHVNSGCDISNYTYENWAYEPCDSELMGQKLHDNNCSMPNELCHNILAVRIDPDYKTGSNSTNSPKKKKINRSRSAARTSTNSSSKKCLPNKPATSLEKKRHNDEKLKPQSRSPSVEEILSQDVATNKEESPQKSVKELVHNFKAKVKKGKGKQIIFPTQVPMVRYPGPDSYKQPRLRNIPKTYQQLGLSPLTRSPSSENYFPAMASFIRGDCPLEQGILEEFSRVKPKSKTKHVKGTSKGQKTKGKSKSASSVGAGATKVINKTQLRSPMTKVVNKTQLSSPTTTNKESKTNKSPLLGPQLHAVHKERSLPILT